MLSSELKAYIEHILSRKIISASPLSGGDINEVYLLDTDINKLVIKINDASRFPGMFQAEAIGLQELKKSNTFTTPQTLYVRTFKNSAFLILEYIDASKPAKDFWETFGEQLAALHKNSKPFFGFENDNYIGSLPQYNSKVNVASEFFITQRLEQQFMIAHQKGFSFSSLNRFYENITREIPSEASSLIHGDLWSGNYIIDNNGLPCLIDPAVAYAPREMDIAMMHLFGGFEKKVFEVYNEIFPLEIGWKDRIPIFQLYYLLVHLNLFGNSYYKGVKNIVDRYS